MGADGIQRDQGADQGSGQPGQQKAGEKMRMNHGENIAIGMPLPARDAFHACKLCNAV